MTRAGHGSGHDAGHDRRRGTMLVEIRHTEAIGGIVAAVHGEVDLVTAPQLADVLALAVASSRAVIVDLCGCTFMDSSGVRMLLQLQEVATERRVLLVVVRLPGDLATRPLAWFAADHLTIRPDRASALEEVRSRREGHRAITRW